MSPEGGRAASGWRGLSQWQEGEAACLYDDTPFRSGLLVAGRPAETVAR